MPEAELRLEGRSASPVSGASRATRAQRARQAQALRLAAHLAGLAPLALLAWRTWQGQLSVNPIADITSATGKGALVFLLLSLAVTPLVAIFGWRQLVPLRRTLGLYAFLYALLHFLTFTVLDYGLDPVLLREAIFEKPYALVGFAAFLILLALALTSSRAAMRRLGQRWKPLHRLVYLAAGLVVVHFLWLVKADIREPVAYGLLIGLLLALRLPALRRRLRRSSA